MKKLTKTILVLALLSATLILTCPKASDHKERLAQEISDAWKSEHLDSNGNPIGSLLGGLLSDKIVNLFVNSYLTVNDYKVASIGTLDIDGETHIATIGLFNHVWCIADGNDLADAITE